MLIPINPKISIARGIQPTRFPYCNCLLIQDKTRTLIETATEFSVLQEIQPTSIDIVLNSHSHMDHIHGNWAFAAAQIGLHPLEAEMIQSKELFGQNFVADLWPRFMPEPLNLQINLDLPDDTLVFKNTRAVKYPTSRVDFTFEEGTELDLGEVKLSVLHTPGHCQGHCCFFWEKEGILFSSDIDFTRDGPWYGNNNSDLEQFIESIHRIQELSPRITIPAHGRAIEGPLHQVGEKYLSHLLRRDDKLLSLLSRPHTIPQLAEHHLIYQDRPHPIFLFWEMVMILKHLERLEKLGEVRHQEETYFRS